MALVAIDSIARKGAEAEPSMNDFMQCSLLTVRL